MNINERKCSPAFTIVELIVVISVIGILAGVTLVSYGSWRTSVATSSVKSDLTHAASAMESSRSFGNSYSATLPTTITSSSGNTMTLTVTSATSFCIDGTSSNSSAIQYYIDNLTQANGPTQGTCATRNSALVPSIPTGLTVSLASTTSLSLTWTAASNATSYIAQCSSDTAFIVGSQVTTVTAPTVTVVITGLSSSTSYYCRVNATNATSTSAWSATVGPTMPAPAPVPANGGVVTTTAGSITPGATNATGTAASFSSPSHVAVDNSGNVYVADTYNNLIRKITVAGVVTTLAGSGVNAATNATGTAASFNSPIGVAVDSSGTVYVADTTNNLIRKITAAGVVTTLAGSGAAGATNATGTAASFSSPAGIAVDSTGTLYVSDFYNYLIRKITAAGVVTTLAGSGVRGSTNATGTAASFYFSNQVAVDSSGNVYVADTYNNLIRKITAAGVVSTLAGSGAYGATNATGTAASFYRPAGVAVDNSGNVYVADSNNNIIRKIQ